MSKITIILIVCGVFAVGFIWALALCKAAKSADEASERWYVENVMKKGDDNHIQEAGKDDLPF